MQHKFLFLMHLFLYSQILPITLHASYAAKCFFLLTTVFKKALKTSALCIPTFVGLRKINETIQKEKIDYSENLLFDCHFNKEAQEKNLLLKNEIQHLALTTMPNEYKSCNTTKELVDHVEHNKTKNLEKLFGKDFVFDKNTLQQKIQKSKEAIEISYTIDPYNTNNPEQAKAICDMLKKAGYDTDSFVITVINDKLMTIPTLIPGIYVTMLTPAIAHKKNDIYYIKINNKYTEKDSFAFGILLHELNHILSGDVESIEKYHTEKVPSIVENFESEWKNKSPIAHKIKAAKDFRKNIFETQQCFLNFLHSAEYVADIKQIVTNPHVTKKHKIEVLTHYAECMEHMLTYQAKSQIEGKKQSDRIFNNTLAQDTVHISEERTGPLYDLTLLDDPAHPSWLSRYQLIMRAKELIEQEQD
ncbi:hypothetical protein EKK58_02985 [Candidatus Dependentiae bacterium]|nr:MAG: hypothetical protein EKK58_02985 [Candidatus Dependentiae bacterium]